MTLVTVASMVVEENSVKRQVVLGMGRTVLVTAIVTEEQEHASATQVCLHVYASAHKTCKVIPQLKIVVM